jgi:hypothetical protein
MKASAETTPPTPTPKKSLLSMVELAIRVAISKHIDAKSATEGCQLSMVVFPPSTSDHVSFVCSCGKKFTVSGMEAALYAVQ